MGAGFIHSGERRSIGGGGRWLWLVAALLVVALLAAVFLNRQEAPTYGSRPEAERPELLLLTSLPIVFPERFALDSGGSPLLAALQGRYRLAPISVADMASLKGHRLLLMAQPRAQPPEVLVELDSWVRLGGRVLLLADPALQWPSDRPLGDPLRPPFAFADTGLLGHWGLRLDAPESLQGANVEADGRTIRTAAPGHLAATSANCRTGDRGIIARCAIGRGKAIVIADADFIDAKRFGDANLHLLLAELAALEH